MWRTEANRRDVVVAVDLVEAASGILQPGNGGADQNGDQDVLLRQREQQLIRRVTAELGTEW